MKTLSILLLSFTLTAFSTNKSSVKLESSEAKVLVCTGKYAKRYHNRQCRGLNACKGDVIYASRSKARSIGLTPCGYCY